MIVIIGLVPEGVGNALASPIHTPGRVVQLAVGVGHARLRVRRPSGRCPSGARRTGGSRRRAAARAGAARRSGRRRRPRATRAGRRRARRSAARRPPRAGAPGPRARGGVVRTSRGSSSEYHGTAWPASSIVTRPEPWSRTSPMNVAPNGSSLIACLWSAPETNGVAAAAGAGRVLGRLDQEAVAVLDVRELVDEARPGARPTRRASRTRTGRRPRCTGAGAGACPRPGRRCRCAAAAPGDSSAPQATTTRGARTVTRGAAPALEVGVDRLHARPRGRPRRARARAKQRTITSAPRSRASAR